MPRWDTEIISQPATSHLLRTLNVTVEYRNDSYSDQPRDRPPDSIYTYEATLIVLSQSHLNVREGYRPYPTFRAFILQEDQVVSYQTGSLTSLDPDYTWNFKKNASWHKLAYEVIRLRDPENQDPKPIIRHSRYHRKPVI
jgi:hypothetical protein